MQQKTLALFCLVTLGSGCATLDPPPTERLSLLPTVTFGDAVRPGRRRIALLD